MESKCISNMGKGHKTGLTALSTMAIGATIWPRVKANSSMQMETCMKENSLKIEQMDMEPMFIKTGKSTKVIGKMTFRMALVRKNWKMDLSMKVCL